MQCASVNYKLLRTFRNLSMTVECGPDPRLMFASEAGIKTGINGGSEASSLPSDLWPHHSSLQQEMMRTKRKEDMSLNPDPDHVFLLFLLFLWRSFRIRSVWGSRTNVDSQGAFFSTPAAGRQRGVDGVRGHTGSLCVCESVFPRLH